STSECRSSRSISSWRTATSTSISGRSETCCEDWNETGRGGDSRKQTSTERRTRMASLKDVEQVADDLSALVDQLRREIKNNASFDRLVQLADEISEHADEAAGTFSTVNDALMSRLNELKGGTRGSGSGSVSGSARAKARS